MASTRDPDALCSTWEKTKTGRRRESPPGLNFRLEPNEVRILIRRSANYFLPPFFEPPFLLAAFFLAGALEPPDFLEDDFFAGIVYPPFQSADAVGVNNFVNKFTTTCE